MSDLETTPIDRDGEARPPFPERPRSSPALGIALALAAVVLASGVIWYRLRPREQAVPPPAAAAPAPAEAAAAPPAETAIALPALDASDALVRELVARLSAHSSWAGWLVGEDLVRRFVAAVMQVAEGKIPAREARVLAPPGVFRTRVEGGRTVADPGNASRFDLAVAAFESVDTVGAARLYAQLGPLFEQAWRELGDPATNFDATLARAVERLTRVPVGDEPIEVVAAGAQWELVDPALASRPPVEKLLLRLGPDHARRVQAKLADLAAAVTGPTPVDPAPGP
jgi:hypothetical protein